MPQFRTKARAVDLLGKGQIADLPTAISELWKNGYDAYGDTLEGALYLQDYQDGSEPIFVLSDDGKGMDEKDILDKWFVLGTDSKSRTNEKDKKGPETLDKEPRVKMGEKGIGRLAVAYLGPQMLMLTKKVNHPLELVFFDWRILENYDLFLSDITIPLKTITKLEEFPKAFEQLKKEFLQNFPTVKAGQIDPWRDQQDLKSSIISECNNLVIPEFVIENNISDILLKPTSSHATRFIIFKPEEQLINLKDFAADTKSDRADEISSGYTISTLVGLFNLFKTEDPVQKTHFWIYETNEKSRYDLLTHKSFFSPKDFEQCDHLIEGYFDEMGQFEGEVRIYNKSVPHKFKPVRKKGQSSYGPFTIKFGYVQTLEEESKLNEEQKKIIEEKLKYYSGLFIYRDGFRVLPYGRPDTDFLEFEDRRSRGAGTYFFSKRRMFGYIEITREVNEKLKDKSSREGFLNNSAFRDFKVDLIEFFKDLAKKYFGTKAEFGYKEEQQEEIKEKAEAEKQEHQRDIEATKEFAKKLNQLPKEIERLKNEYDKLIFELEKKSKEANLAYDQIEGLLSRVEQCKVLLAEYKVSKPARFKPTDLQTKKYYAYNKSYKGMVEYFDESSQLLNKIRDRLKVHELFKEFQNKIELYKNTLSGFYDQQESELENIFIKISSEFNNEKQVFLNEFEEKYTAITPAANEAKEIARSMRLLEKVFKDSQERILKRVEPYFDHLRRLSFEVNEDNLVGYYKQQFEEMKEEWNKTYELAQLGIAVEIIDHQFNTLYSQLAESIKTMANHLQPSKESVRMYKHLSNAFEHLQDNYKLLQPLYRTTGRIRTSIKGEELKEYTEEFFKEKLIDNQIKYTITENGKKWTAQSYESIFKPVLINIINNAIYWLQGVDHKEIKIDAIDSELLIMNSGEPIEDYQLDDIFKLFYSNRPKGRGIGLYLAKQSLNGIGYDIQASNDKKYNLLKGACFIIKPIQ
jgi:signal transduction histidine kinase